MTVLLLVSQDNLRNEISLQMKTSALFNQVIEARTIHEARELSELNVIDLFVVDMNLDDGIGSEFVRDIHEQEQYRLTWTLIMGDRDEDCDEFIKTQRLSVCNRIILKPIDKPLFTKTISDLIAKRVVDATEEEILRIKRKSVDYFFNHNDIVYVETVEKMAYLYTSDNKHKIGRITLNELELRLANKKFMRVHRSYIINTDYIDYIKKNNNQNQIKIRHYDNMIPIGRTYRNILGLV